MHPLIPHVRRSSGLTLHQRMVIERDLNEVDALRSQVATLESQLAAAQADRAQKRAAKESAA